jgi:hypothetical protein
VDANPLFNAQFRLETGADFDVRLFARRKDRDDFAFFIARDGKVEDRVITIHLSFAKKVELPSPLRYSQKYSTFIEWVRDIALADAVDWMNEGDLTVSSPA